MNEDKDFEKTDGESSNELTVTENKETVTESQSERKMNKCQMIMFKIRKGLDKVGYSFCHLIVSHPYLCFGVGFNVHLSFVILTIIFYSTGKVDIFRFAFDNIPLLDRDYEPFHCFIATNKMLFIGENYLVDNSLYSKYSRSRPPSAFYFYYDSLDDNILKPKILMKINEFEERIFRYFASEDICQPEFNKITCANVRSLIRIFLAVDPTDLMFKNLNLTIKTILSNSQMKNNFDLVVSKDFQEVNGVFITKSLKSKVNILRWNPAINIKLYNLLRFYYRKYLPFLYIYFDSKTMIGDILFHAIRKDAYLVIGCFLFIFGFTYLQTKSFFISFFGILSILTSFLLANLIYVLIFRIKFFGFFHVLSIFLILGIGCDNIYVFFDRWKAYQDQKFDVLTSRLTNTFKGVGWSMFITSSTTAMAFCILQWTPLLTINTFGLFVFLLIVSNYLSVLLYFPSIVIIYHLHFENENKPDRSFLIVTRFFGVHYYRFLNIKYMKDIILAGFAVIAIFAFVMALQIRVAENFPDLLVSSTNLGKVEKLKTTRFIQKQYDEHLQIAIVTGASTVDFSKCSFWDYKCYPELILDEHHTFNSSQVQSDYQHICNEIINADTDLRLKLALFNETSSNIVCLVPLMDQYFKDIYPLDSFQCPWNKNKFLKLVDQNRQIFGNVTLEDDYPVSFESAMYYFFTDGFNFSRKGHDIFSKFGGAYSCVLSPYIKKTINLPGQLYGCYLKLSMILINITLFEKSSGFSEKFKIFNNWIKWHNEIRKNMSFKTMVCSVQQDVSGNGYFHWVHVQKLLTTAAIRGVILGLVVAVPILFFATMNFYNFGIILLGTSLSTLTAISLIPTFGWKLGILESITVSIVVGMTIDFLVHMGLVFNNSSLETRESKTQYMLQEMGISIVSGMITTLGAAFFLFFCKVMFLFQFGIFIFITITSAGFYSLVFLPCFFLACGPTGDRGKLKFF